MAAQVAPESRKLKNKYETKWSLKSPEGYLKINAIFQKYMDQAISVNTFYNPEHYPDNEIPESVLIKDIINHYKWGGKTLYYFEVYDGAGEQEDDENCESCTV
jgi:ribonucleoside-diphosphate reductase alpha chain